MPGLTINGFTIPSQEEIREEINDRLRAAFGTSIDLSDGSLLGNFVGIMSERYALLWELSEAINSSQSPDGATGVLLDALCALTGTLRRLARPSTVVMTLVGDDASPVPTGSRASVTSTGEEFVTTEDVTLEALDAWVALTVYALGDRVSNMGSSWQATDPGTSAGAGGPDPAGLEQGDTTVDSGVVWMLLGEGDAVADAESESANNGPIVGLAGDITTIETPVTGWNSVFNVLDAEEGEAEETDEDLRIRRELELARAGTSTVDAIRADLLSVDEVTSVRVFNNPTDGTVDGMPPHSVEALIRGGDNQAIFDQLLASVAAGIATFGGVSGTALDSQGTSHTEQFSRPTEIPIYVDVEIIYNAELYPADGAAQIKAAIVAYGDAQETGKNVVSSALVGAIFAGVAGIIDVTVCHVSIAINPTVPTTIAIALRELAVYDTSRITIVSAVAGTP